MKASRVADHVPVAREACDALHVSESRCSRFAARYRAGRVVAHAVRFGVPRDRRAAQALEYPDLYLVRAAARTGGRSRARSSPGLRPAAPRSDRRAGARSTRRRSHARFFRRAHCPGAARSALCTCGIPGLDADFELQRARGKRAMPALSLSGRWSGITSKCTKSAVVEALEKELEDAQAYRGLQIERAIDEPEMPRASRVQRLELAP